MHSNHDPIDGAILIAGRNIDDLNKAPAFARKVESGFVSNLLAGQRPVEPGFGHCIERCLSHQLRNGAAFDGVARQQPVVEVGLIDEPVGIGPVDVGGEVSIADGDFSGSLLAFDEKAFGALALADVHRQHIKAVHCPVGVDIGDVVHHERGFGAVAHASAFEAATLSAQNDIDVVLQGGPCVGAQHFFHALAKKSLF